MEKPNDARLQNRRPGLKLCHWREFCRNTSGAALVELAISLPILILFLFGMISWGYTLSLADSMYDAARQAARELSVGTSNESQARASALANLALWSADFTVTAEDSNTTGTDDVRVTVVTTNLFASLLPFVPMPTNLTAQAIMRKE